MASPAAVLNILLTANSTQANAALAKTQGQLTATGATATKTGAVMKKAMLGIGVAAVGAGAALYKIGEEFDDAYDKIRVGTGATGRELEKLKGSFRGVVADVPASFGDAGTAVADLNTRIGLTDRPLERMSKQMLELSRITETNLKGNVEVVSKAFVDWEVKTKDMSSTLDGFFRLSQKSGASVDEIASSVQRFGSPLRQLGFSLDEAAAMWATFVRAGVNTQTMVPGLKLAISNLTRPTTALGETMEKLGISVGKPDKALREILDLLGNNSTLSQVERTGLAMDVFGKRAGADMAEAIKQGRFELDDMLKVMRDGDDTIRKAGRETMDFAEHWQQFKNNVLLKLEPVATRVFEGIGEEMKELTRIFRKEGLAGVGQHLADRMGKALDRLTVLVAKKAPGMAKALVEGFLNANAWTRLLVAGVLLKKLGGGAAFTALGKKLGGKMGAGIAIGLVVFGPELIKAYKGWVDKNAPSWREAGKSMGQWFVNGLIGIVNVGIRGINDAMDKANILGKLGVDAPNIGEIGKVDFTDAVKKATAATKVIEKAPSNKQWEKWSKERGGIVKRGSDAVTEIETEGFTERGSKEGRAIRRTLEKFDDKRRKLDRITASEADTVIGNTDSMVGGVSRGLQRFEGNVNKALRALKVKELRFGITGSGHTNAGRAGSTTGYARGGIIGGTGDGDKVPVLAEPGEGFLNKTLMKRIGGEKGLNFLNALVPRFQKGGLVQALGPYTIPPIAYDANHAGGNSHVHINMSTPAATVAIGRKLQQMGMMVSEHPAFGGVNFQHSATGGHYDARAIDVNTAADETRAEVASIARLLGGKGGGLGAVVEKLKRILLTGPDGPLKSMGQSALDKARKAANAYIAKQMPHEGLEGGAAMSGSGDVERMFAQVAKKLSTSKVATLALGMAGYAESGMRDLSYGHSSSQGALQLLASTAAGLGVSPHDEKAIASLFFQRGFYGRGGANALAAQGLPAHLVAQGVQGSAFSSGSNYLAQSGSAQAWMKRYGLKLGGMVLPSLDTGGRVTQPGIAQVHPGDVHMGGGPSVVNVYFDEGMEWLRDFMRIEIDDATPEIVEHTLREGGRHRSQAKALRGRS